MKVNAFWRYDTLCRGLRLMRVSAKKLTEAESALSSCRLWCLLPSARHLAETVRKWSTLCVFVCVAFALVHLLLELFGLLLVRKAQSCHTVFELEGMKKGAVLVVLKCVIYLLIPKHSSVCWTDINELDPECIAYQVVREHCGSLESCVGPSVLIRMCHIQTCYGDCVDLVACLRYSTLDSLLVVIRQN